MRKLSVDEAKDLYIAARGRTSKISSMLATLAVGEALEILKSDWRGKKPPYAIVNHLSAKTGRKFIKGRLPDGTGWAVKRIA